MCLRDLLDQFKVKRFTFHHERPGDIIESQWECFKPRAYTLYRCLFALGVVAWFVYDFVDEMIHNYRRRPYYYFIFVTNWAFLAFVLYTVVFALLTIYYNFRAVRVDRVRGYSVAWFLYVIAANGTLLTSAVYWFALNSSNLVLFSTTESKVKHSLNALLIVLDFCVSGVPIHLFHSVYPMLVGLVYAIFSVIFYAAGGEGPTRRNYIYPTINWAYPATSSLAVVFALLTVIFFQLILCTLYLIRIQISRCVHGKVASAHYNVDSEKASILKETQDAETGYSTVQR